MAEQDTEANLRQPSGSVPSPRRATTVPPPIPAKARAQTQQLPSIIHRAPTASSAGIAIPRTPTELGVPTTRPPSARAIPSVQPRPSSETLEPMRRRPQATPAIPPAEAARELAAARAIDGSTSDALRDLVTSAAGVRTPTTPPPAPLGPPPMPIGRESARAIASAHDTAPQSMPRESSKAIAAAHAVVADPRAEGESTRAIAAARNVARPRALTPIESIQSVTRQLGTAPALTTAEALREASAPHVRPGTIPPITSAAAVRAQTAPVGNSSVPGLLASIPSLAAVPVAPSVRATTSAPVSAPIRAASLPPPIHTVSPVVLPPYVPAPDVGDPAEAFSTMPVEKFEFTEHVEKLPFTLDELEATPRTSTKQATPAPRLVRHAPWIGVAVLLGIFVIGYFVFNGEGKPATGTMTHVSAPAPSKADNAQPAVAAEPVKAETPNATDPGEPRAAATAETGEAADHATDSKGATETDSKSATDSKGTAEPNTVDPAKAVPSAMSTEPKATDAAAKPVVTPVSVKAPTTNLATSEPAAKTATDAKPATKPDAKPDTKPAAKKVAAATAPVPKGPRGTLAVTSNKKVQIYLDGRSASSTTPLKLELAAGTHKLTLWDTASGKTQTMQITVTAGKTTAIDKRF